jgi:hypothetical protein
MADEPTNAPKPKLPRGLPECGVLVLCQRYPGGWPVQPGTDPDKFRWNLQNIYAQHDREPVSERYDDQPGQSFTGDNAFVQKVLEIARSRVVIVSLEVPGPLSADQQMRRQGLEQQLVQMMNKEGVVVLLVKASSHTMAYVDVHEQSPDGRPRMEKVTIDLAPYLDHPEH